MNQVFWIDRDLSGSSKNTYPSSGGAIPQQKTGVPPELTKTKNRAYPFLGAGVYYSGPAKPRLNRNYKDRFSWEPGEPAYFTFILML